MEIRQFPKHRLLLSTFARVTMISKHIPWDLRPHEKRLNISHENLQDKKNSIRRSLTTTSTSRSHRRNKEASAWARLEVGKINLQFCSHLTKLSHNEHNFPLFDVCVMAKDAINKKEILRYADDSSSTASAVQNGGKKSLASSLKLL